jgi:hypothetical protein
MFLSMIGVVSGTFSELASFAALAYIASHCSGVRIDSSYIEVAGLIDSVIEVLLLPTPPMLGARSLSLVKRPRILSWSVCFCIRIVSWILASSTCLNFNPPIKPPVAVDGDVWELGFSCAGVVWAGVLFEDFQGTGTWVA